MEVQSYTKLQGLRFERKFPFSDTSTSRAISLILNHPKLFQKAYNSRWVNNIYFDTNRFDFYHENQFGKSQRKKVRIRWYGDLFGSVTSPVLELKIKEGMLGKKRSFPLREFNIIPGQYSFDKQKLLDSNDLPDDVKFVLRDLEPTLLNRYSRDYFRDYSGDFRITLDSEMEYYELRVGVNNFRNKYADPVKKVIELKYHEEFDDIAKTYSDYLPYRLAKHSKYVNGIEYFKSFAD